MGGYVDDLWVGGGGEGGGDGGAEERTFLDAGVWIGLGRVSGVEGWMEWRGGGVGGVGLAYSGGDEGV